MNMKLNAFQFGKNYCIAVLNTASEEIARTEPCLSLLEVERIGEEEIENFFRVTTDGSDVVVFDAEENEVIRTAASDWDLADCLRVVLVPVPWLRVTGLEWNVCEKDWVTPRSSED